MRKVKIKELVSFIRGVSYKKEQATKEKQEHRTAILRANNIADGEFIFDELVFVPSDLISKEQVISKGDIVITMSSGSKAHVGKVAIATHDINAAFGAFCAKIVPRTIDTKFLYYILRDAGFRRYIEVASKGTNINNIKQSYILDYEIFTPPLPEQKRIVARIEELFSELDNGVETLKKTKQQLAVYRQSVLKAAFEGTWINSKPERLAKISDLADVGTGATPLTSNPSYYGGEIAWVTSSKINDGSIYLPSEYITEKAISETNCKVYPPHTLLVAMYGEGKTRGKCAELMIPAATNQALAAIELHDNTERFRNYVKWFLVFNYQLIRRKASGGVQPNLNLGSIKNITIPIFNDEDQARIVSEIESRLSVCDSIEKTVDAALQQAESMRQSILKKAFEGKL